MGSWSAGWRPSPEMSPCPWHQLRLQVSGPRPGPSGPPSRWGQGCNDGYGRPVGVFAGPRNVLRVVVVIEHLLRTRSSFSFPRRSPG